MFSCNQKILDRVIQELEITFSCFSTDPFMIYIIHENKF